MNNFCRTCGTKTNKTDASGRCITCQTTDTDYSLTVMPEDLPPEDDLSWLEKDIEYILEYLFH